MPGVPGSLFDYNDSDKDVFQASVILGCTITSPSSSSQLPRLVWSFARSETTQSYESLRAYSLFHPPLVVS